MNQTQDKLTGLPKLLEPQLKRLLRIEPVTAMALLDVDHFEQINDQFGYEVGDKALISIADLLSSQFPESVYRISGDEFAILMPGTALEQAFLKMEETRKHIFENQEQFALPHTGKAPPVVSVTVGVAQYPRDAKDGKNLMEAANAALRTAKESGRNQVALPLNEEMIMKTCYYPATSVRRLKSLAERVKLKESQILREALNDVLRKYDQS